MRRALPLLLLLLAGCYRPKPATVPLRTLPLAAGEPDARCLVVFLPGRGDGPEDYAENGFPEALRRAGSRCAMVGVDSHLGYFAERTIVTRLEEDVIGPARARGQDVWLVGISLGGLGSLLYTRDHPDAVKGLVLLAPYLGEDDLIDAVKGAGGLAGWTRSGTDFERLWLFMKGFQAPGTGLPPLWLGYGTSDRFAETDGLLGAVLPPGHVFTAPGGHTWRTWRKLWEEVLASGAVLEGRAPGASPASSTGAASRTPATDATTRPARRSPRG
jgi:pimeloyl-ACP methyl ester carboxylesterase